MCFKKKPEIVPITSDHIFLGFGINKYSGSPLDGCINDIEDEIKKLKNEFPLYQAIKYLDNEVTTQRFISEIRRVFEIVKSGHLYLKYSGHGTQIPDYEGLEENGYHEALYLINGPLVDDMIYELQQETPPDLRVTAKFDSCFSGDMGVRYNSKHCIKSRFYQMPGIPRMTKPVNRFGKTDANQRWVIISGCGEEQTSADAWFNGKANGAFSFYDFKSYNPDALYSGETVKVNGYLQTNGFEQRPELSGPSDRINETVLI
jgi:hypothetical protein